MLTPVRRALLSVSDKTGIVEFARELKERGIELLSTGGTAQLLVRHGISVKEVAEHTGFPEIMGGRVKPLHPKIHGGLLGRRGGSPAIRAIRGLCAGQGQTRRGALTHQRTRRAAGQGTEGAGRPEFALA